MTMRTSSALTNSLGGTASTVGIDAEDSLQYIVDGLNALELAERGGRPADELWREVRSILGGLVPAVHWPTTELPAPVRPRGVSLLDRPATPDPQWSAALFNRLARSSRVQFAVRVAPSARHVVEPFVYKPAERERVVLALWRSFFSDGEWRRLRRCRHCSTWFRDPTLPRNAQSCSRRCTDRYKTRAVRRLRKAALKRKARPGRRSPPVRRRG